MVLDARLGYDPDEWEECPEPEHFLVFSAFTRYLLTAGAIAFVYYFFKLLDEHKNPKGEKVEEVVEHVQVLPEKTEVREYLGAATVPTVPTIPQVEQLSQKVVSTKFPSLEVDLNSRQFLETNQQKFNNVLTSVDEHLYQTKNMDLSPISRDSTQFEQIPSVAQTDDGFVHDFEHVPPHLKKAAEQYYAQQDPRPPVPQHQQSLDLKLLQEFDIYDEDKLGQIGQRSSPAQFVDISQLSPGARALIAEQQEERFGFQPAARKLTREKRLSEQDERALQDWEKEKALLEADRFKKLMDHEAGGDSNTDLSSSQKAYDHFAPASHISYESRSGEAPAAPTPTAPKRALGVNTITK
uniref:Uncharacterized protein n=1 Tax=Caenorhabditis japonica TaxID=281687 RepID=K7H3X2_CAEJA